ncbi:MAG: hypothetical protein MPL62_09860 [Alphaproteobacteria bacterium]|nr:hypothetical protein [Alphaproteobacteria bacterium]
MITPVAAGSLAALSLLAAAALTWPGAGSAQDFTDGADQQPVVPDVNIAPYNITLDARTVEMIEVFKLDIGTLLEYKDTAEFNAKTSETLEKHDGMLRDIIEHARQHTGTREFTEQEIQEAIGYIFREGIKEAEEKARFGGGNTVEAGFGWTPLPLAHAACPPTTSPSYKQMVIDIRGGTYGNYEFNGGNALYRVQIDKIPNSCSVQFKLYFYDEDHPWADTAYDILRGLMYNRDHDEEIFIIHGNSRIEFPNTWSSDGVYACLDGPAGCHYTTTKPYVPGSTVYVSNTWNHMMDTSDTNWDFAKSRVP